MTEPLSVDPLRLGAIGQELAGLVFPALPSPIAATGSDPVSSAINATMPNLESLVTDGMPGVKAALARTASNMTTAAEVYTKADQSLGDTLRQAQFGSGPGALAAGDSGAAGQFSSMMSGPLEKVAPGLSQSLSEKAAELSPRVGATVPQLVALAPAAGQLAQQGAPMMMSTVTQFAGQGASGGSQAAAPATLAGDTKKDGEDDAESDTGDGAPHEGAGAGVHTVGSVPTHGGTGGNSPTDPTSSSKV
jgi:hypothetical protein